MPRDVIIEFDGVKKAFGPKVIYEDLSLAIERGETLVLLGGSGSGKSVALKILIGLIATDGGDVRVHGQSIVGLSEEALLPVRKQVAMLFQGGALFDSMSVGDNVAYPLREHTLLSEEEIAHKVAETLARVGLKDTQALKPADLSGGMKKRAALARAIIGEPEVLLYDEPTTGLDPANTRRIAELIRQLQRELNMTSIVVTHDIPCAALVSDRIAFLCDKRVRLTAPTKAFMGTSDQTVRDFIYAMETHP